MPPFHGGGHRARAKVRRPLEGLAESGDGGPCAPPAPAAPSDSPSMRSRSASTAGRGRRGSAWAGLGAARAPRPGRVDDASAFPQSLLSADSFHFLFSFSTDTEVFFFTGVF